MSIYLNYTYYDTIYNMYVYASEKFQAFNILMFGFPLSSNMVSIITLYHELFIIGIVIIFMICDVMSLIIDEFNNKVNAYPFHFSPEMESFLDIFFLLFPSSLIIYILFPTLGFLYVSDGFEPEINNAGFSITAIGHQWYWTYIYHLYFDNSLLVLKNNAHELKEYAQLTDARTIDCILEENSQARLLNTDQKLVIPSYYNVRIDITSEDVIHSWSLPQLGIKVDAIPGRVTSTVLHSEGTAIVYGQCSELCGPLHGFMPIEVYFVPAKYFFLWAMYAKLTMFWTNDDLLFPVGININKHKNMRLFSRKKIVELYVIDELFRHIKKISSYRYLEKLGNYSNLSIWKEIYDHDNPNRFSGLKPKRRLSWVY